MERGRSMAQAQMNAYTTTMLIVGMLIVALLSWFLVMQDYDNAKFGEAFGCGRFYAGNFDPADDPRDEHSRCYPYYKTWEATEQWPAHK